MDRIKILLVTLEFPPMVGGIGTHLYNVCANFSAGDMIVLAPDEGEYKSFDAKQNFKIYRRKYRQKGNPLIKRLPLLRFLFHALIISFREKVNLVAYGYVLPIGLIGLFIKLAFRKPYLIFTWAADVMIPRRYTFRRWCLLKVLRHATKVITASEFTKKKQEELGIESQKIVVIKGGADEQMFKPLPPSEELVQRYNLRRKKVLLTLGRLVERKGVDMVIRSLPQVVKRIPNLIYLVAGSGPYEERLRRIAKEMDVEEKVIFAGHMAQDKVPFLYSACDLFIMVSREVKGEDAEGFGLVFIEANACGKPVVGGRSGGVVESVIDGKTGLLVDPLSEKEIAEAIIKLMSDEGYAAYLGQKGRERVEKELNWSVVARKLELTIGTMIHI